jgi:hypothetical protein
MRLILHDPMTREQTVLFGNVLLWLRCRAGPDG